jgi:hypothetical protein
MDPLIFGIGSFGFEARHGHAERGSTIKKAGRALIEHPQSEIVLGPLRISAGERNSLLLLGKADQGWGTCLFFLYANVVRICYLGKEYPNISDGREFLQLFTLALSFRLTGRQFGA